jgi:hypothetical protein
MTDDRHRPGSGERGVLTDFSWEKKNFLSVRNAKAEAK